MSRDPLTRMDVDTKWPFHRKFRQLRQRYPADWPRFFAAYMALLGEAWAAGDRKLTLEDAWLLDVGVALEDAAAALADVGLLDRFHRIPILSWKEWFEPVKVRIQRRSEAGRVAAEKRWSDRGERNASPMRSQCTTPSIHPSTPSTRTRANATASAPAAGRLSPAARRAWSKAGDIARQLTPSAEADKPI